MSFGSGASRARRDGFTVVRAGDPCPCGSGALFGGCCAPLLAGAPASTPEALMRSRYTAFVVGDAGYLGQTWHPRTRPDTIDLDPRLRWTGLEIVETTSGAPTDAQGTVEFRASWRQGGESGTLHERSRFVRLRDLWRYVDGDVN